MKLTVTWSPFLRNCGLKSDNFACPATGKWSVSPPDTSAVTSEVFDFVFGFEITYSISLSWRRLPCLVLWGAEDSLLQRLGMHLLVLSCPAHQSYTALFQLPGTHSPHSGHVLMSTAYWTGGGGGLAHAN